MNNKDFYKNLIRINKENQNIILLTCLTDNGKKILIDGNNNILLSQFSNININFNSTNIFSSKDLYGTLTLNIKNKSQIFYFEKFQQKSKLLIFGAGHIGKCLCEMANFFEFDINIIDDRKDLMDKIKVKNLKKHNINGLKNISNYISINKNDYIVIVTRGHVYDKIVLEQVLNYESKYIGMIGSKKRVLTVKNMLKTQFKNIDKIYAPIGLPISGNPVEEITLSILSEIIAVKNDKLKNLVRK